MGLFSPKPKLQTLPKRLLTDSTVKLDYADWQQVFSACLGRVCANQMACADLVIKGRGWNVDFERGIIAFDGDEFPVQFLGSEANSTNTWLWAWQNVNNFPASIIQIAEAVQTIGAAWHLAPLTTAEIALDDTYNGHNLAIVAAALCPEKVCYYRGPHSGGAILVAFSNLPEAVFAPVDAMQFIDITMQCIQEHELDHRIFVESFLDQNHTPYVEQGDALIAHFAKDLKIEFEPVGTAWRISSIKNVL